MKPFMLTCKFCGAALTWGQNRSWVARDQTLCPKNPADNNSGEYVHEPLVPDTYLHVLENRTGEEWILPITGRTLVDLELRVLQWIREEFGGELHLDGKITTRGEGEYYARIIMEGRPPDTIHCWDSGGFYLK